MPRCKQEVRAQRKTVLGLEGEPPQWYVVYYWVAESAKGGSLVHAGRHHINGRAVN